MDGAQLQNAVLTRAQLQGAIFGSAELQGAKLQGVNLEEAWLPGAHFREAQLQGLDLRGAQLQGVNLEEADLQGANLDGARLQGAILKHAQLQGAYLGWAQLQGINLEGADLRSANLDGAQLGGADLRAVELYGGSVEHSGTPLVDLRSARWTPLEPRLLAQLLDLLGEMFADTEVRKAARERIERANRDLPPPVLESCLIDPEVAPGLKCQRQWLPAEVEAFRSELFPVLEGLACQSSSIARGVIRQVNPLHATSGRFGLAGRFAELLDEQECQGLSTLPAADREQIRDLAMREEEGRRGQSKAGKPAVEVPASPTPPPVTP